MLRYEFKKCLISISTFFTFGGILFVVSSRIINSQTSVVQWRELSEIRSTEITVKYQILLLFSNECQDYKRIVRESIKVSYRAYPERARSEHVNVTNDTNRQINAY